MVQWKLSNLALPCQEKNIGSKKWYLFKNKLLDRTSAHSTLRMYIYIYVCMCVYCVKTLLRLLNGKVHLSRICLICYRNKYCFVAYVQQEHCTFYRDVLHDFYEYYCITYLQYKIITVHSPEKKIITSVQKKQCS